MQEIISLQFASQMIFSAISRKINLISRLIIFCVTFFAASKPTSPCGFLYAHPGRIYSHLPDVQFNSARELADYHTFRHRVHPPDVHFCPDQWLHRQHCPALCPENRCKSRKGNGSIDDGSLFGNRIGLWFWIWATICANTLNTGSSILHWKNILIEQLLLQNFREPFLRRSRL